MLRFKQYLKEFDSDEYEYKEKGKEYVTDIKPVSKGEQEFVDKHVVKKTDYPVDTDNQHDGGTTSSKNQHGRNDNEDGEKNVVKQGTSELPDKSGYGKSSYRPTDKTDGDKTIKKLRDSFEKINSQSEESLNESIIDDIKKVAKSGKETEVKFKNGKTMDVDKTSAEKIMDAWNDLSSQRRKKFEDLLTKGPQSFMKALDFADSI